MSKQSINPKITITQSKDNQLTKMKTVNGNQNHTTIKMAKLHKLTSSKMHKGLLKWFVNEENHLSDQKIAPLTR